MATFFTIPVTDHLFQKMPNWCLFESFSPNLDGYKHKRNAGGRRRLHSSKQIIINFLKFFKILIFLWTVKIQPKFFQINPG